MGERKVLNKYYPPEFDARLLPRNKRPKDMQVKVRNMLPFTVQCSTCGEYIYRGRKFNSRKELVQGEDYLGIKIWRFYIRCTRCNAEITFKTDPKNGSYICELGAKQYFEKFHEVFDNVLEQDQLEDDEDAEEDPLALLEQRQQESKREMEQLEALEELREITQRNGQLTYEELVKKREDQQDVKRKLQDIEDEYLVQQAFAKKAKVEFRPENLQESCSSSSKELPSKSLFSTPNVLFGKPQSSSSNSGGGRVLLKPKFVVKKK
eukprot:TRINITY_DN16323_c0_g1_i1.p1 TRINITY_DN16323_c0_g1~~TRINITY_DN16323_c0_g1_i1.p1  ORF type:complete len:264 (-),score=72.35 TRINITY_DN16323_c0_g1_i1:48-839(-)